MSSLQFGAIMLALCCLCLVLWNNNILMREAIKRFRTTNPNQKEVTRDEVAQAIHLEIIKEVLRDPNTRPANWKNYAEVAFTNADEFFQMRDWDKDEEEK